MEIRELSIAGAFEVTPQVHGDDRGVFLEWFRADRFEAATGHPFDLKQANYSVSAAGSIRGVHYADVPPGQAKWVSCPHGALLDVVVDIRVGSPTFGRWEAVLLDTVDRRGVYLSEGLGHAFMALEDDTVIGYLCSAPYTPEREHGVHPLDPDLAIAWPTEHRGRRLDPLLSPRDDAAPTLAEARTQGLLPTMPAVTDYLDGLRGLTGRR
jgi:dTDP-4-dehydrorhamnose 3,5-epimerase